MGNPSCGTRLSVQLLLTHIQWMIRTSSRKMDPHSQINISYSYTKWRSTLFLAGPDCEIPSFCSAVQTPYLLASMKSEFPLNWDMSSLPSLHFKCCGTLCRSHDLQKRLVVPV